MVLSRGHGAAALEGVLGLDLPVRLRVVVEAVFLSALLVFISEYVVRES